MPISAFGQMHAKTFLRDLRQDLIPALDHFDARSVATEVEGFAPALEAFEQEDASKAATVLLSTASGQRVASLLLDISVETLQSPDVQERVGPLLRSWRQWLGVTSLSSVIAGLLLARKQHAARKRVSHQFDELVYRAVGNAAALVAPGTFAIVRDGMVEGVRSFPICATNRGQIAFVVVPMFETLGTSTHARLFSDLPAFQDMLARRDIALVVVADGPGWSEMEQKVKAILPRLQFFTNLSGVESGVLLEMLPAVLARRREFQVQNELHRDGTLFRIADEALNQGTEVNASILNVDANTTEAFLLRYRAAHPSYALKPTRTGVVAVAHKDVAAVRAEFNKAKKTKAALSADIVVRLAKHVGASVVGVTHQEGGMLYSLDGLAFPIRLPEPLPLFIVERPDIAEQDRLFEELERYSHLSELPGRLVAILDPFESRITRASATSAGLVLRIQFAVLDSDALVQIFMRAGDEAREELGRALVRRADLRLVSPYVAEGPTSKEMFFGRHAEMRRVAEQAREHSFALIGGRKAGKTSLLLQLKRFLQGDFNVMHIDCQAYPEREAFLASILPAEHEDGSVYAPPFSPFAERILRDFLKRKTGGEFAVLLVDEVDDLFAADAAAAEYPHILSRAFRALAQEGLISLVATGERTLYSLTRDPASPHWNFCTPIRIGPLDDEAAWRLVDQPLTALGIDVHSDAVRSALLETVAHPNLLQYLGTEIVTRLSPASARGEKLSLAAEDVTKLCSEPKYRERFMRTFWSQATTLERLLSVELRFALPANVADLRGRLRTATGVLSASSILEALSFLELYGIARQTERGFVLTSVAFERSLEVIPKSLRTQWRTELLGVQS